MKKDIDITLLTPLQKIEVVDGDKSIRTGSIGYVSFVGNSFMGRSDLPVTISFSRLGKGGKPRIGAHNIKYCPISPKQFTQEELNKVIDTFNGTVITLKPIEDESKDVRKLNVFDFICYAQAFSLFMAHLELINNNGLTMVSKQYILDYIHNINDVPINLFGRFISGISNTRFTAEDAAALINLVIQHFLTIDNRSIFMDKAHKVFSIYKDAVDKYTDQAITSYANCKSIILGDIKKQNPQHYNAKELEGVLYYVDEHNNIIKVGE